GDEYVAPGDPAELGGAGDAARGTFIDAFARRETVEDLFFVLHLGAREDVAQADEDRAHEAADRWGQGREVRRWRFGRAKEGWRVFGGVGRAVFGALGQLVRGRATSAGDQRAHLVEAGVQHLVRGGDAAATRGPPASRKGGAPHEARGPDVAIDATLVAEPVHQAGLP